MYASMCLNTRLADQTWHSCRCMKRTPMDDESLDASPIQVCNGDPGCVKNHVYLPAKNCPKMPETYTGVPACCTALNLARVIHFLTIFAAIDLGAALPFYMQRRDGLVQCKLRRVARNLALLMPSCGKRCPRTSTGVKAHICLLDPSLMYDTM